MSDVPSQDFVPASATDKQLSDVVVEVSVSFLSNFVTSLFAARDKIVRNGEIDYEKMVEQHALVYKMNAEAADVMSRSLLATQTNWGVEYFTRWRDTYERLAQDALDPILDARARYEKIVKQLDAFLELPVPYLSRANSPAGSGGKPLKKLIPYLGNAWDFSQMAAGLIENDREKFSGAAAGLVGGTIAGALAGIGVAVAGLTAWPALIIVGAASMFGALYAPTTQLGEDAGSLFDWIKGNDAHLDFVSRYRSDFGTSDNDIQSGLDDKNNLLVSGSGDDVLTGGSSADVLVGGDGADHLKGKGGNDSISGGDGNDLIEGGLHNDTMEGGDGFDTYQFSSADFNGQSQDVIIDSDGSGKITFNGLDISGTGIGFDTIKRAGLGTWLTSDGQFRLSAQASETGSDLVIVHISTKSRIVVRNWRNGGLGITLPGYEQTNPENSSPLTSGDDSFGTGGNNAGQDRITSLAGNDGVSGGDGDDYLDGGIGNDLIFGGAGNDEIIGGDGDDEIIDGSEDADFRELSTSVDREDGSSEKSRFDAEIARLGSAVVARGVNWYIERRTEGVDNSSVINETFYVRAPQYVFSDPNQRKSGDDIIDAGAGNDRVASGEGNDTVVAGSGNDYVNGGHDDDMISGGDGNDVIDGDAPLNLVAGLHLTAAVSDDALKNGSDTIDGGTGNDTIRGGGGGDMLYGGADDDTIHGRGHGDVAGDNGDADSDYIDGGHGDDLIFGDDGDDNIIGGDGADRIRGDNGYVSVVFGNDTIDAGAGNDVVTGDGGDDHVLGGLGDDVLSGDAIDVAGGEHGQDDLRGGSGNDTLYGQGGRDTLYGDDGDDIIVGDMSDSQLHAMYHDNDLLYGGAGNDQLFGNGGNDTLDGGSGMDRLSGGTGDDRLAAGAGNDTLSGGQGNDLLRGDAGDDELSGDEGNDTLFGGEGNDLIASGDGDDIADGGDGNDEVDGGEGNDQLAGGGGRDTLDGDAGNDSLQGGMGDDAIYGGEGNDTLVGGTGNDTMNGAAGNDLYLFERGWGVDSIQGLSQASAGSDVIRFGTGIDPASMLVSIDGAGNLVLRSPDGLDALSLIRFFDRTDANHRIEFSDGTVWTVPSLLQRFSPPPGGLGTTGNDAYASGEGADTLNGNLGNDLILGGSGNDVIHGGMDTGYMGTATDNDTLFGGDGDDAIDGQLGDDILHGDSGNDALTGGDGSDALYGGAGNDILDAGGAILTGLGLLQERSNDLLIGGEGNDTLIGGLGRNSYVFDQGFGQDRLQLTDAQGYWATNGTPSETAVLMFREGISAASLAINMVGDDLVIGSGADRLTIVDYNLRQGASIEFQFSDGSALSPAQLALLTVRNGGPRGDTMTGGNLDDTFHGGGGDDSLSGGGGNDVFQGGSGTDTIYGGAGDDVFRYGLGDGRDYIYGGTADLAGNDTLELGAGIGPGDVTLYRTDYSLFVVINATGNYIQSNWTAGATDRGIDVIRFADGSTLTTAQIDAMSLPAPPQLEFYANTSGNTVTGNALSNDLYGAASWNQPNTLIGGKGDDRYIFRWGDSQANIVENADEGIDTVYTSTHSFTLSANVENLVATGYGGAPTTPRTFVGNALSNVIDVSGDGDSNSVYWLDGGAGADVLIGGIANDTFVVDRQDDVIIESARSTSLDTVEASISYSVEDRLELENITLTGSGAINATGNTLDNRLDGSLSSGVNTLAGGLGNDTYVVGAGDMVVEAGGAGVDTVVFSTGVEGEYSTAGYVNVERFALGENTLSSSLVGGTGDDDISGNLNNNILDGGDGNDILRDRAAHANFDDADQLYGGNGNDTLISARGNDLLVGGRGDDTMSGNTATFAYSRGDGRDTIVGTGYSGTGTLRFDATVLPADIRLSRVGDALVIDIGNDGVDRITIQGYWSGDNVASPVSRIEFLNADGSTRELWSTSHVIGRLYAVTLTGGIGDDMLSGSIGYDTLIGNGGNDTLDGGAGSDILDGGAGNDNYVFDGDFGVDRILAMDAAGNGADIIRLGQPHGSANVSWSVNENDDVVLTAINNGVYNEVTLVGFMRNGAPAHEIRLSDGTIWTAASIRAQSLATTTGDDFIVGFGGDDSIDGLAGNDSISGRGGNDTLRGGDGADQLDGGSGNDRLYGDAGDDTLIGGAGSDILEGGAGNDIYYVDDNLDTVVEVASAGTDTVHAFVDYTLSANVENLQLRDGALRGTGNTLNNRIDGNELNNMLDGGTGNDTLAGGAGDDTYLVDSSADVVTELTGNGIDTVQSSVTYTLGGHVENLMLTGNAAINGTGNSLANVLTGNSGNNTLNGGGGIDTMSGGAGDDTYVVDVAGDLANEAAGEGVDTVQAGASYTLSANVEKLTLTGIGNFTGSGNALNNVLTGNSGNNTLNGGAGNDSLNGGAGTDTLVGGTGDDTYIVDTTTDVITELAGEGTDTISTGITFDLTSRNNIENLTLTGSSAINGTGNSLNNVLIGNTGNNRLTGGAGNDTLDGGAGTDTMLGGTGDDVYFVNVSTDVVTENAGEGNDTVNSSITYSIASLANLENITLIGTSAINATGNNSANLLIGNSGANAISAGAGNDTLDGGAGADTLTGGTGNDLYRVARGHGVDTVVENDATAGNYDIASFLSGIAFDQLWFRRPSGSNNLEISIIGTNDKMVVKDWYLGNQYRTEEIQVADGGRYLLAADVQTLVNAMASMTPPPLGQTTLTASQRSSLDSALTAAWKTRARSAVTSVLQAEGAGLAKPMQVFGVGSPGNVKPLQVSGFDGGRNVKPLQVSGFDARQMTRWNWSDGRNWFAGTGRFSGDWLRHRLISEIRWGKELSLHGVSTSPSGQGWTATCQLPPASANDEDRRRPFDLDGWMVDHTPTDDEDRRRLSDLDGWMVDHTPTDDEDRRRPFDLDGWMVDHTPTDDEDRRRHSDLDSWMVDASRSRRVATDCGKAPLVTTCAKPPGANAAVLSNCRRLIDLMAISEGNERVVDFMSLPERGQPDRWVP